LEPSTSGAFFYLQSLLHESPPRGY
jgi:hypothetical protein